MRGKIQGFVWLCPERPPPTFSGAREQKMMWIFAESPKYMVHLSIPPIFHYVPKKWITVKINCWIPEMHLHIWSKGDTCYKAHQFWYPLAGNFWPKPELGAKFFAAAPGPSCQLLQSSPIIMSPQCLEPYRSNFTFNGSSKSPACLMADRCACSTWHRGSCWIFLVFSAPGTAQSTKCGASKGPCTEILISFSFVHC